MINYRLVLEATIIHLIFWLDEHLDIYRLIIILTVYEFLCNDGEIHHLSNVSKDICVIFSVIL
jgi:hypothetical protein